MLWNLSWQFVTKCSVFINETMGNIKRQLKEAIKTKNLIGLLPHETISLLSIF